MPTRPITGPLTRSLSGGVTGGGLNNVLRGFYADEISAGAIVPFGTAAINDSAATGMTRAVTVDSSVTFLGQPTTKLTVTGTGSAAFVEAGVISATVNLSALEQQILTRRVVVMVKSDGANTITGFSLYIGDATYANFRTFQGTAPNLTDGGWQLFERITEGASSTTGTVDLSQPVRVKLRINLAANTVAGSFWFALAGVLPAPRPTVVFTCDDGYDEWAWLADEAAARRVPISFGVSSSLVNTAGFLTDAQVAAIGNHGSGLFEITNHAQDNTSLTAAGLPGYIASVEACRSYIEGLGLDPYAARIHQFVQGDLSTAAIDQLKALGYHSARAVGASNGSAQNVLIAESDASPAKYNIPVVCNLQDTQSLATVQGFIEAQVLRGTAFIMGHKFDTTAAANQWIAGYDSNHGVLNLLDWLADKRDNHGWRLLRWSDWSRQIDAGRSLTRP